MAADASPLRSSRVSFRRPALLWPRVHLYDDRLELTGWRWSGRYRRTIPFLRILQVDAANGVLLLWLLDGTTLRLRIDDSAGWQEAVETRL